jgi:hypothetical protein
MMDTINFGSDTTTAQTSYEVCESTGLKSLTMLAGMARTATVLKSKISGLSIDSNIGSISLDTTDKDSIATAVTAVKSSYCSEGKTDKICNELNTIFANNSTNDSIADAVLEMLKNQ